MGRRETRRDDFEDDGRVIADMSGVERPSLFGAGRPPRREGPRAEAPARRREPDVRFTTTERLWMALGALRAGLTVGCIYVVFLGIVIVALIALWTALSA